MGQFVGLAVVGLCTLTARADLFAPGLRPSVIYGDDNRVDLYDVHDPVLLALAQSTVALVEAGSLAPIDAFNSRLAGSPYREDSNLCPEERFAEQNSSAFCSGSLIAPDLILTAGHCLENKNSCAEMRVVFGFSLSHAAADASLVPVSEIYSCEEVLYRVKRAPGPDFAIVRLDRPVTDHAPLTWREHDDITMGDDVLSIGHPAGLPAKVTTDGTVRAVRKTHFVTNLSTFIGNSGSPVFNRRSSEIEGVLTAGESDYVADRKRKCMRIKRCDQDECQGEFVTKISEIAPFIPRASRSLPRNRSRRKDALILRAK